MAENRRRRKPRASGEKDTTAKDIKFADAGEDENELEPDVDVALKKSPIHYIFLSLRLIIFLVLLVVSIFIYRAWTPQNVNTIPGYGSGERSHSTPQDIPALLLRAQEANYPLFLSEKDINLYLGDVLRAKQSGPMGILARYEGVAVRLYDGYAEVVIVRTLGGRGYRQTVSMYVSPESQETINGPIVVTEYAGPRLLGGFPMGGRIGKLPVPQGYLLLIKPAFDSLAKALAPELDILLDPHRPIQIKRGELQIHPSRSGDVQ